MIPLRDANPTRRTPVVTLSLILLCFVAFGWELVVLAQGGDQRLGDFLTVHGVVPADLTTSVRAGNWIMIRAKGKKSNGFGLGATVKLQTSEGQQVREINNVASYLSSSDVRLHFGLGQAKIVTQIEILWPSGTRQVLKDVPVNQILVVEEP